MNKRDKDQLIFLAAIVCLVVLLVGFIWGTTKLPIWIIVTVVILLKFAFLQPAITGMFYQVYGRKKPVTRFIPFYNEVIVVSGKGAAALLISYCVLLLSVVAMFLPLSVVESIAGERASLNYGIFSIRLIAIVAVVNFIVYGIVMSGFVNRVAAAYEKFADIPASRVFKLYTKLFLFIPVIRTAALADVYNRLHTLVKLNNFNVNQIREKEFKEVR